MPRYQFSQFVYRMPVINSMSHYFQRKIIHRLDVSNRAITNTVSRYNYWTQRIYFHKMRYLSTIISTRFNERLKTLNMKHEGYYGISWLHSPICITLMHAEQIFLFHFDNCAYHGNCWTTSACAVRNVSSKPNNNRVNNGSIIIDCLTILLLFSRAWLEANHFINTFVRG